MAKGIRDRVVILGMGCSTFGERPLVVMASSTSPSWNPAIPSWAWTWPTAGI